MGSALDREQFRDCDASSTEKVLSSDSGGLCLFCLPLFPPVPSVLGTALLQWLLVISVLPADYLGDGCFVEEHTNLLVACSSHMLSGFRPLVYSASITY